MKILIEPDNQKHPRIVCRKCNAVLEFDVKDVTIRKTSLGNLHVVECPHCKETFNTFYLGTMGDALDKLKKEIFKNELV